jgi:hypothetical protein
MPKIKTVSVTYGRKVNLGDFSSATVDCTVWADVEDGEDLDGAMKALWGMAKENVKTQILPLVKNGNGSMNVKEAFLGLPVELQDAAGLKPEEK